MRKLKEPAVSDCFECSFLHSLAATVTKDNAEKRLNETFTHEEFKTAAFSLRFLAVPVDYGYGSVM